MNGLKRHLGTLVTVALLTGALAVPARALDPAFSNDQSGATRTIRIAALLLASAQWENSEPCAIPVLAGTAGTQVTAEYVPSTWDLVNPLAMPYVTQELSNLWDPKYNGPVTFDGLTADIVNDKTGDPAQNDAQYNSVGNPGGPNTYHSHAFPMVLREFGPGGSELPLPDVGQPLPRNHPAYWEVPLTPRTVEQLANFDVVLLNLQRNIRFTPEELDLLREFLDLGGTLFLDNSHGLRIMVEDDDKTTLPNANEFLLPVQFVDGFPYSGAGPTRSGDPTGDYPLNSGQVTTIPDAWVAAAPNHPLLNAVHPIAGEEIAQLGDVRAADHLILNRGSGVYLAETILRVNFTNNWTDDADGNKEPALAVVRMGAGKLILSGIDMMEDVHKIGRQALGGDVTAPDDAWLPDLKFMVNMLAWQGSFGGNRRGGPSNRGVTANAAPITLTPRYVWNSPDGGVDPANLYDGTIEIGGLTDLESSLDVGLREPLCVANGLVYIQYESGGEYYIIALDTDPTVDRDGDGRADDGWPDYGVGAPFDVIWISEPLGGPIAGATVVSITSDSPDDRGTKDVLIYTQHRGDEVRLGTLVAGAVGADFDNLRLGDPFFNWVGHAPAGADDGFVTLPAVGSTPQYVGAPVVYGDTVYVTVSYGVPGLDPAQPAGWTRVYAVHLVPDPAATPAVVSGQLKWMYPDVSRAGENVPAAVTAVLGGSPSAGAWLLADTLKQVDIEILRQAGWGPDDEPIFETLEGHGMPDSQLELADSTRLTSTVGLITDQRTGLTAPTVFIARANGDVWAVSADDSALGWRLPGEVFLADAAANPFTVTIAGTLLPPAEVEWRHIKNMTGQVIATEVRVVGDGITKYREAAFFAPVMLSFYTTVDDPDDPDVRIAGVLTHIREKVYPRHRLLRGNRDSGSIGVDPDEGFIVRPRSEVTEWQAHSYGAPMLVDSNTVVATTSALWSEHTTTDPPADGVAVPTRGALASGQVTFYNAGTDALAGNQDNPNNFNTIRWVFNPDPLMNGDTRFSSYGSPVKYGNSVVVAGRLHGPDWAPRGGAVIAIDPNPSFSMYLGELDPTKRYYLVTHNPAGFTGDNSLVSYTGPSQVNAAAIAQYGALSVIDPNQYQLDFTAGTISLVPDRAHQSVPAMQNVHTSDFNTPLYGRPLWLVADVNGNGRADEGVATPVYFPVPVRWAVLPHGSFLPVDGAPFDVAGNALNLSVQYADGSTPGPAITRVAERPQVVYFDPAADEGGRTVLTDVEVGGYVTVGGSTNWTTRTMSFRQRIGEALPPMSFSPVVGGDKIYLSGTAVGTVGTPALETTTDGAYPTGLIALRYGQEQEVVDVAWLRPDTVTGWTNAPSSAVDASYVRGTAVPADDGVFVSYALRQGTNVLHALYSIGGTQLLVTESQRLSKLDLDGAVRWQLTGVRVRNGAERATQQVQYNPSLREMLTSVFNRPSRAYNLPGNQVLIVDTGNDRVVQAASTGNAVWPFDTRGATGLQYFGLRNFGLSRPSDAKRARMVIDALGPETRDLTVIADRGNRRVLLVSSHERGHGGGTQTYYDALTGQPTDDAGGWGIPLTAPQVYDPVGRQWVELPYAEVQLWNPGTTPAEPTWDGEPGNTDDPLDTYVVARVDGYDQLFNIDLFPGHDGVLDADDDGVADGVRLNLDSMRDRWAKDYVFRGLKGFQRFKVGERMFLAVIAAGPQGGSQVMVYEFSPTEITAATAGIPGTHLAWPAGMTGPWTFDREDYEATVYDAADAGTDSYYARAGVSLQQREIWWAEGAKGWNPTAVGRLQSDNMLTIVNGASNSVNQMASNSEVLLVRFDPANLGIKRVETMLPDLSTTSTYPASQEATRRRPSTGSYPVSSPVYAGQ